VRTGYYPKHVMLECLEDFDIRMLAAGMPSSQLMLPWKHATVEKNDTGNDPGGHALRYNSLKLTGFD
jgi:hypothetical protein